MARHRGSLWTAPAGDRREERVGECRSGVHSGINYEPNVYQRGVLVEVVHDAPKPKLCLHDNGAPCLRPIPTTTLAVKLSSCARFVKWSPKEQCYVDAGPPEILVPAVRDSIAFPGVPVVTGVVSSPILRADGSIAVRADTMN